MAFTRRLPLRALAPRRRAEFRLLTLPLGSAVGIHAIPSTTWNPRGRPGEICGPLKRRRAWSSTGDRTRRGMAEEGRRFRLRPISSNPAPTEFHNPWVIVGGEEGCHLTDHQRPSRRIRAPAGLDDVHIHNPYHSLASWALPLGKAMPASRSHPTMFLLPLSPPSKLPSSAPRQAIAVDREVLLWSRGRRPYG